VIETEVERTRRRSGWSTRRTLEALGVSPATYYRNRGARPTVAEAKYAPPSVHAATPEERAAVVAFKRKHPELRHRSLAWTMVDQDVACLSPSTVYRILKEAGLVRAWDLKERGKGKVPTRPTEPNRLWQTDIRYVKLRGVTYYLLVFVDVVSRWIPYWELLRRMDGATVSLATLAALETLPEAQRQLVQVQSDNGSAFVSADFARVLRENGVGHVRIHPGTPEQNGHVERTIRTLGEPLHEDELATYDEAHSALAEIIAWYNDERLHSSIEYLTPASVHRGDGPRILEARRAKLAAARQRRKEDNLDRRQRSLALPAPHETPAPHLIANCPVSHFV
jgi:putative transposase